MSSRHGCKTFSWRRLEEDVLQTRLKDVFKTSCKEILITSWRRFWKTHCKYVLWRSWRRLGRRKIVTLKMSWRNLGDVLENQKCLLGCYFALINNIFFCTTIQLNSFKYVSNVIIFFPVIVLNINHSSFSRSFGKDLKFRVGYIN